ncbi:hypothetical protein [Gilliamella sp. A7]|uniref:hypothetical protein n=1 Tax=Gilliamella sp. A7 TaxID=1970465 RepID=UPI000A33D4DB|nr:hypothetical protein [Gilliamella sp. A7]OTQ59663.1 hypothetical protein B6D18_03030 [Gilliamella sp. A7]
MKFSQCSILLFNLFFLIPNSYAEINIKKCNANQGNYITFGGYDSHIAEKIINYKLHKQPDKRENSIIKIFANENGDDRNYWLTSIQTDNKAEDYLFYQLEQNKFTEVDLQQFQIFLPKIVECNQIKQVPI